MMQRRAFVLGAPLALMGCAAGKSVWAPDDAIAAVRAPRVGPHALTLYTMLNSGSGNGAHTSLLINGSQRVMFDPAGSFASPVVPERNDVLFGMTPRIEQFYISYHARSTYHVEGHHIEVTPEIAEQAMRLSLANGPVSQGHCTRVTSSILGQLPGFEGLKNTYFPNNLRDEFALLPGVTETEYRENDADDKSIAAAEINAALTAGQ